MIQTLKTYRKYILSCLTILAIISFILLLTTPGIKFSVTLEGVHFVYKLSGPLSLFGGNGKVFVDAIGTGKFEFNYFNIVNHNAKMPYTGVIILLASILFIISLVLLALIDFNIIKLKDKKSKNIFAGLFGGAGGLLIVEMFYNPNAFKLANRGDFAAEVLSLDTGWIVSVIIDLLILVTVIVIFALTDKKVVEEVKPNVEENINKIEKLKTLLDNGAITEEEYNEKKKSLLDNI